MTGDQDYGAGVNDWVNVVRRARLGSTAHSVALTVASYANPDGTKVYPGIARLAVQCELSYAAVRRALDRLRGAGLLELVRRGARRSGRSDEYRLILAPDLMDRVDVPSPEEERKTIEDVKQRERFYRSPVSGRTGSTAHQEPVLPLSTERPPSIQTSPGSNPPSPPRDLRTDVAVVGDTDPVNNPVIHLDGGDGEAPLAPLASTDEKSATRPPTEDCPACGVILDPGRFCWNRQCADYGRLPRAQGPHSDA